MNRLKVLQEKYLPWYALKTVILALTVNFICYNGIKLIVPYLKLHYWGLPFENDIPFVPFFIYIYVLAYGQWISGYFLVCQQKKEFIYQTVSAEIYAKFICIACFIIFPCTIQRPVLTGNDFSTYLANLTYKLDSPFNLFPSIHCLESWFCVRTAFLGENYSKIYKIITLIFALLVFASTVLVKQHVIVDIFAGVLVYEIGLMIAKRKVLFK